MMWDNWLVENTHHHVKSSGSLDTSMKNETDAVLGLLVRGSFI